MKTDQPPNKTFFLIIISSSVFMTSFAMNSINVALPQIGTEFAMDAISLGWVATAFILASAIFVVPFGRIADIYGRKKIFNLGLISFTFTSLLLLGATSGLMLIVFRFLQGIGTSLVLSTGAAIVTSVFPREERGKALGFGSGAVYLGGSSGPFLGGIITEHLGWRFICVVWLLIGLVIVVLSFWKLKGDWAEARGEKFDVVGSIIYGIAIASMMYGFTHMPGLFGIVLISLGIIGFGVFTFWETRAPSPILNIRIFKENRVFTFSCLAALINFGATIGVIFLLNLYLQYIKGFSPQDAGFILVSQPIVQVLCAPLAGRISDRVQPRIVASAGMALVFIALILLIFLNEETELALIIINLMLLGAGVAFFVSPNTNAVMSSIDKKLYGVASAITSTMRQLGSMGSMGVVILLFALYMGDVQITPEYHGEFLQSIHVTFIIYAIFSFVGIFTSWARGTRAAADL